MTKEEKAETRRQYPLFPVQRAARGYPGAAAPLEIPWSVAEKAYGAYAAKHGADQSLERMAQRGGFSVEEMDMFYPPWRDEASELATLRAALASERERAERALSDGASLRAELETEREVYENTERAREAAESSLSTSLAEVERLREALRAPREPKP